MYHSCTTVCLFTISVQMIIYQIEPDPNPKVKIIGIRIRNPATILGLNRCIIAVLLFVYFLYLYISSVNYFCLHCCCCCSDRWKLELAENQLSGKRANLYFSDFFFLIHSSKLYFFNLELLEFFTLLYGQFFFKLFL